MDRGPHDWDLLAVAAQDDAALRQLFERHRHYVYRLAWGLLREDQAADDVVQEVFLKIRSGRVKAKRRARFTTWLYQVALNTAREQGRKRRRMWGDADAATALRDRADAHSDHARLETLEDLSHALGALAGRQREVVLLRLMEGFDTTETAKILRSEEHTSELQSRETISYAVFCLKKKKKKN